MNSPSIPATKSSVQVATPSLPDRRLLIDDILDISEAMFTDAKHSKWEQLCKREARRQPLIWKFSEIPVTETERRQWHVQLTRIQHINRRLTEMARAERELIARQLGKLRQGCRMTASYHKNTLPENILFLS